MQWGVWEDENRRRRMAMWTLRGNSRPTTGHVVQPGKTRENPDPIIPVPMATPAGSAQWITRINAGSCQSLIPTTATAAARPLRKAPKPSTHLWQGRFLCRPPHPPPKTDPDPWTSSNIQPCPSQRTTPGGVASPEPNPGYIRGCESCRNNS